MFRVQMLELEKDKWIGWNLHINLIMVMEILMLMLSQQANLEILEELAVERKQQDLESILPQKRFYKMFQLQRGLEFQRV